MNEDITQSRDFIPIAPYLKTQRLKRVLVSNPVTSYETVKVSPDWNYIRNYIKSKYEENFHRPVSHNSTNISNSIDTTGINDSISPFLLYNNPQTHSVNVRHIGIIKSGE